jgi:pSer/pThr/pTyr-binding forkhead associated (FHA) protein
MIASETAEKKSYKPPFAAPHVYVLAVIEGPDSTRVHRLCQEETVLGRNDGADLLLDDDEVSKRHCVIRIDGPVCTLVELGSLNGTTINGRTARKDIVQRLRHLDVIQVGCTKMLLLAGRFPMQPGNPATS